MEEEKYMSSAQLASYFKDALLEQNKIISERLSDIEKKQRNIESLCRDTYYKVGMMESSQDQIDIKLDRMLNFAGIPDPKSIFSFERE